MTDDKWKRLDLIVKFLGVGIITASVSLYGILVEKNHREIAESTAAAEKESNRLERQITTLIEFQSEQKKIDVDVGMQLFRTLIDDYLQVPVAGNPDTIKAKLVLLRLIALNFQDVPINLKPLFEDLDQRLKQDPSMKDDREYLKTIAKEVANRQAFRLTFLGGVRSDPETVEESQIIHINSVNRAVKVSEIERDRVRVEIFHTVFDDNFNLTIDEDRPKIGPFWISYFDMPILDNVKLDENTRLAVLLEETDLNDSKKATLRIINFRSDLANDRFDLKELSRSVTDPIMYNFWGKTDETEQPPQ